MNSLLKSLAPLAMLASAAFGVHAADFPGQGQAHHHRRAVRRRRTRPTGSRATWPKPCASRWAASTVVVDNAAGAGGTIGANKVAKAAPDGHTILLHHIGMATQPALYRNLPFKTLDDFEYLGMVNDVPMTLIGRPSLPANNFAELRTWLNANKGKVNLANAGLGAASHLCGLLFMNALKFDMTTVPYKGTGPAMTDLIGGQVDLMCDQTTNTTGQIEAKKVKAFAVTTPKRLTTPALKDLPTLQEVGLKDFEVTIWHGLYAPKGTPADVAEEAERRAQGRAEGP